MPDGRRLVPFSELVEVNPRTDLPPTTECSFVGMEDVSETGRLIRSKRRLISDARGYTAFREGDVLFAKITPCMENGKGALATGLHNGFGFGSTEFHVLRARQHADPRFVAHWCQTRRLRAGAEAMMTGSAGQRRVPRQFFDHFCIPELSKAEQQRIADALDSVDESIRIGERHIAKMCNFEAAHAQKMVDEFRRRWGLEPLGHLLAGIEAGTSPNVPDRPAEYDEWGVLKVSAIRSQSFEENENKVVPDRRYFNKRIEVRPGDLLISRANTPELVGLACYVTDVRPNLMLSDKTLRLVVKPDKADPLYLASVLATPVLRRQIENSGTGSSGSMKNISQDEIRSLLVPCPTLKEQRLMVRSLGAIRGRTEIARRHLAKLHMIKHGLMDDLLTGRLQ